MRKPIQPKPVEAEPAPSADGYERVEFVPPQPEEAESKPQRVQESAPYPFAKLNPYTNTIVHEDPDYGRIMDSVFRVDLWKEYAELEHELKVGEKHSDYATLMRALDTAEDNARRAHRLYVNARLEQARYEMDAEQLEAVMRTQATRELQQEKLAGTRSKAITDADVVAQAQVQYPEEWKRLSESRLRYRKTVEHIEVLATLWRSRCSSLQTMVAKVRT